MLLPLLSHVSTENQMLSSATRLSMIEWISSIESCPVMAMYVPFFSMYTTMRGLARHGRAGTGLS